MRFTSWGSIRVYAAPEAEPEAGVEGQPGTPPGVGGGAAQDLGAPALDPEAVERLVRRARDGFGRGRHPEAAERAGRGLAEGADQPAIGCPGLGTGHLLLDDRPRQRLQNRPA